MSQVPRNVNVTGWPTVGAWGENVNSAVGAAEETPAEAMSVSTETRSARADASTALTGVVSVFMGQLSAAAHDRIPTSMMRVPPRPVIRFRQRLRRYGGSPPRHVRIMRTTSRYVYSRDYSHSIVPGGLLVTSTVTRLTCGTSLVMRVEMVSMTSYGSLAQSAVIASSEVTGRRTTGWP
jgi:hypothetical protein